MINKAELSIGNWVEYCGNQYQIAGLDFDLPHLNTSEFKVGVVDYYHLQPIPILLEHLQESPSLKFDEENGWFVSVHEPDITFEINHDFVTVFVENQMIKNVTSIHHLQKLYFELTDNEIEIEL